MVNRPLGACWKSVGNALSNQNDLPARLKYLWCTKPGMIEDSYAAVPVTLPSAYWRGPADYQTMQATMKSNNIIAIFAKDL